MAREKLSRWRNLGRQLALKQRDGLRKARKVENMPREVPFFLNYDVTEHRLWCWLLARSKTSVPLLRRVSFLYLTFALASSALVGDAPRRVSRRGLPFFGSRSLVSNHPSSISSFGFCVYLWIVWNCSITRCKVVRRDRNGKTTFDLCSSTQTALGSEIMKIIFNYCYPLATARWQIYSEPSG